MSQQNFSEENPLDDFSQSRIMRRCGQLNIPYEDAESSPYFQLRPEKRPKSNIQYRDGVKGTVGWGKEKRPLADEDTLPFTHPQMLKYLGLGMTLLDEATILALKLSLKERVQFIERIASSIVREIEDTTQNEEQWGRR